MPKNGEPLKPLQIELISKWIGQGGKDDTPASVQGSGDGGESAKILQSASDPGPRLLAR